MFIVFCLVDMPKVPKAVTVSQPKMKKMQTDGKSPSSQEGKHHYGGVLHRQWRAKGALAAEPPLLPTDDLLQELQADSERLEQSTPQRFCDGQWIGLLRNSPWQLLLVLRE